MAGAADPRRHRRDRGDGAARRLRAQSRTQVRRDRQRARRRGHRDPLRDVLCGPRALGSHSSQRDIRPAHPGHGARRDAVDPSRLALHRRPGPARRVRDTGAALHRREPAHPALHLPAAPERRAGVGRVQEGMAAPHHPDADPDRDLSVGLGGQIPRHQPAVAGDGDLPRLLGDVVRGVDSRAPWPRARKRRRRDGPRARANRYGSRADAAPVCGVPVRGPAIGRGSVAAVRLPARARRGSARDRGGPARGVDARDRRACHAARLRNLAGQVSRAAR